MGRQVIRCAIGRSGFSYNKREGDGTTPIGRFYFRELLFRSDREKVPLTALPHSPINLDDGWSDDPSAQDYNRRVRLPYPYSHEKLFLEENIYDFIIPLGYNDDPPISNLGSAIFLHVAKNDFSPTGGCIAVARSDIIRILGEIKHCDSIVINPSTG